jgi:DNA-binding XRE family transcriptional regulator
MSWKETGASKDRERKERMQLARMCRRFRKRNLMTQRNLAELSGISRRTIQMIEGAAIVPRVTTQRRFLALAAAFERSGMETWLKWIQSKSPVRA